MKKLVSKMFYDSLTAITFAAVASTMGMVVDGVLIGQYLGEDAMAAFGIASPIFLVLVALGGIFSAGIQAKCAENIGAGKVKEANGFFSLAIILSLFLSVLMTIVLLIFQDPIAGFLGASKKASYLLGDTSSYLSGLALGVPAILMVQCLQGSAQLDGQKVKIFISTLAMTFSDIIADLINVYLFHGGMFGMAVATSVSYYFALVVFLIPSRSKKSIFHLAVKDIPWKLSGELISTGLPTAISRFSSTLRTFALNKLLLSISGAAAVTALSSQTSVNNFFSSVGFGISMTVLMLSGIYFGEQNRAGMKALLGTAMKASLIIVSALGIFVFLGAPFLAGMYIEKNADSFLLCVSSIRFLAVSMPLHALCNVFANYLQGSDHLRFSHLTCLMHELVYIVLCAFIFGNLFGTIGVWLAFPLGKILTLVSIAVMAYLYQHEFPRNLDGLLFLPADFDMVGVDSSALDINMLKSDEDYEKRISEFCKEYGLAVDEQICYICGVIKEHCFKGKGESVTLHLRLIKKPGGFVIRSRDNIKKSYDVTKWQEYEKLSELVNNLQYNRIMGTNSLYMEYSVLC